MEQLEPSTPGFTSEQSTDPNGNVVLTLRGELDMSSAVKFRQTIEQLVESHDAELVFDLAELAFMDSSGIAVLVYAANNFGPVELRNSSPIIRRIIEATGLTRFLRLDPS
jgi:anti-sigma B factor antagonist